MYREYSGMCGFRAVLRVDEEGAAKVQASGGPVLRRPPTRRKRVSRQRSRPWIAGLRREPAFFPLGTGGLPGPRARGRRGP